MQVSEFLRPEDVVVDYAAPSKLKLLHFLSKRAGETLGLAEQTILDPLHAREALGSTGIGEGVAIPHTKVAGLKRPFGMLVRLARPVDFDAVDETPVDLVFMLLMPADGGKDHLNVLAAVARQLRSPEVLKKLRQAGSAEACWAVATSGDARGDG
ncbi:PTS sugar transporter subunit IIA [Rhizobiaceae sp. 2RAB30]